MKNQTSILDSLPQPAQEQILAWLELDSRRKVLARIALPPPDGFGLKLHLTTLTRFYARHRAKEQPEDLELARLFAPNAKGDPMACATRSVTSGWALELGAKPRRSLSGFKAISRWVLKQRELDQRERELALLANRLNLDREKWEYDIARQVLNHRATLDQIASDLTTTDEEKINRARSALFNTPIDQLPK